MDADVAVLGSFERIGILGAGTMGAGIAQVVAEAGIRAILHDPIPGAYEGARERIAGFLHRKVEKGTLEEANATDVLARIAGADSLEELAGVDLLIEAIPEDLELKRELFVGSTSWPPRRHPGHQHQQPLDRAHRGGHPHP